MKKETTHWLLILGLPSFIGVITLGSGFIMLPLGGIVGVFVGLLSTTPYFTIGFKIGLLLVLVGILVLGYIGFRFRKLIWGKVLVSLSIYLWCLTGLIGFGPA